MRRIVIYQAKPTPVFVVVAARSGVNVVPGWMIREEEDVNEVYETGDYLVTTQNGVTRVWKPEDFAKHYEPVREAT